MKPRINNLIQLNAAVLLWGGTALFAKLIKLPAFEITCLRSVPAVLCLVGVLALFREGYALRAGRDYLWAALSGLALAAHWVTYFKSIQLSTVAIGILSLHVYPVMTALAEPLFFKEPFHPIDLLMTVAVLAGIGIMVPEFTLSSDTTQGILWGILSAVFWTARNLFSRQLVRSYSGLKVMVYQLGVCVLVPLPFVVASGQTVSPHAWGQLALLGVIFTALPHTLFTNSLRHLTTRTVSVMATLLPIYGAVLAALVLDEIPAFRTLIGGAIVIAVVFYETWRAVRN
jgi:drug/metabolite transporter (DMT)-like permease